MAKHRKHLSRAHRAAIAAGLRRHHRAVARQHRVRVRAARKAAATRAARKAAAVPKRAAKPKRERGGISRRAEREYLESLQEDFEDLEIEIAVDYVPNTRGR